MDIQDARKREIEERVMKLFQDVGYNYTKQKTIDIIHIVKQLGFKVGSVLLEKDEDGFVIVQEGRNSILGIKTDKLIGVNANRELKWKRFIIAHELGHYVLHYDKTKHARIFAQREHVKGKGPIENEADFFAANILMPRDSFIVEYEKLEKDKLSTTQKIKELSDVFTVTDLMVSRRIEELSLR